MPPAHGLQISPADAAALTPEQKRFNTLIRQIGQARRTLAAWRDNVAVYARAHVQVVVPLERTLDAARREWAFALDRLLDEPGWTQAERATLRELICDAAADLLDAEGEPDADVKALHDKHSEVDFDRGQQEARAAMKEMAEAMTGIDLGDIADIDSDAELLGRVRERLQAEAAAEEARTAAAAARPRRKSAAQQRRETEAQLATQSVREVFRKLASTLHPDRETDPAQREAKTALMQKANQAYAANDLLALLELQLQIEQVDAAHIASAGAQRLKHYNKVLAEQLSELKAEIERTEAGFRIDFGLAPGWGLNPARLTDVVGHIARDLRADAAACRREMQAFTTDRATTKRWLKREQRRLRDAAFDDGFF